MSWEPRIRATSSRTPLKEDKRSYPKKESKISWECLPYREIPIENQRINKDVMGNSFQHLLYYISRRTTPSKSFRACSSQSMVKKSRCGTYGAWIADDEWYYRDVAPTGLYYSCSNSCCTYFSLPKTIICFHTFESIVAKQLNSKLLDHQLFSAVPSFRTQW